MSEEKRLIQPHGWSEPGVANLMTTCKGYAMVRRPGAMPFVMSEKDWSAAPKCDANGDILP